MLKSSSGALKASGGGALISGAPSSGDLPLLDVATDMTYAGAARFPSATQYVGSFMAIRYRSTGGSPVTNPTASDVRHILTHLNSSNGTVLVEYRLDSSLSTSTTLASLPLLTETRRWSGWSNYSLVNSQFPAMMGGAGGEFSMAYFEHATNTLWYSITPIYAGSDGAFANLGYVILDDAEARAAGASSGVTVSSGNKSGTLYYKNTGSVTWKASTQGISEIPTERQAAFGGKRFLTSGGNTSNIGDYGARGVGLWIAPDFPNVVTSPPADDAQILTTAKEVYRTGPANGIEPPNMWRPANLRWPGGNIINTNKNAVTAAGIYTLTPAEIGGVPQSRPFVLNADDCMYFLADTSIDSVSVRPIPGSAPTGGAFAIERWNGSAWVEPADLTIVNGDRAMSQTHNVFDFDMVATVSSQPHASMSAGLWWRIRRTTTGTTAGLMFGIYSNHSRTASFTGAGTSRPEPVGGSILNHADALAAYNSNKAASHSFAYAPDYVDGTCWIRTNAVEGILCSGKFSTYHAWYGCGSLWARYPDTETGTQTHHVDSGQGTDVGNGNWCTGRSMHYFFVIDPQHVLEAHSDLRAANPSG
jgi:hypothetical protein